MQHQGYDMEKIEQYDIVLLKDGREGCAVEILGDQDLFLVDIGSSPEDWDNIDVKREEIEKVLIRNK
jgi:hypothetical protein